MQTSREKPHERIAELKRKAAHGPVILEFAFRPFFFCASLWAVAAVGVWLGALSGLPVLPGALDGLAWHRHEIIYGFLGAAIAGFILTAIPNWTGRLPVSGWRLGGLVALWAAGRAGMLLSGDINSYAVILLDMAFPVVLVATIIREIAAGRNWRNLLPAIVITLFMAGGLLSHFEIGGFVGSVPFGERLSLLCLTMLVGIIGGRIIPSFTRNWLVKRGSEARPAPFGRFDRIALAALAIFCGVALVAPEGAIAAVIAGLAAAIHLIRLLRWRGWLTVAEPLVLILHLGYLWLVCALVLFALSAIGLAAETAAVHALGTGLFGTMIAAVVTRASLGHTGRKIEAGTGTSLIFLLILCGGVLRTATPFLDGSLHDHLLLFAGVAWIAGFGLLAVLYAPVWFGDRAGAKKPSRLPEGERRA